MRAAVKRESQPESNHIIDFKSRGNPANVTALEQHTGSQIESDVGNLKKRD